MHSMKSPQRSMIIIALYQLDLIHHLILRNSSSLPTKNIIQQHSRTINSIYSLQKSWTVHTKITLLRKTDATVSINTEYLRSSRNAYADRRNTKGCISSTSTHTQVTRFLYNLPNLKRLSTVKGRDIDLKRGASTSSMFSYTNDRPIENDYPDYAGNDYPSSPRDYRANSFGRSGTILSVQRKPSFGALRVETDTVDPPEHHSSSSTSTSCTITIPVPSTLLLRHPALHQFIDLALNLAILEHCQMIHSHLHHHLKSLLQMVLQDQTPRRITQSIPFCRNQTSPSKSVSPSKDHP